MKIERITLLVKEELEKLLEGLDKPGPGFRVGEKPPMPKVQMISVNHLTAIMKALPAEDVNNIMELADNQGLFSGILEAFVEPGSPRAARGARYRRYNPQNPFDALRNPEHPAKIYKFEDKPTVEQVVSMIADLVPHERKELITKLDQEGIY